MNGLAFCGSNHIPLSFVLVFRRHWDIMASTTTGLIDALIFESLQAKIDDDTAVRDVRRAKQ